MQLVMNTCKYFLKFVVEWKNCNTFVNKKLYGY